MAEAAPLWVEYPADDPADPSIVVERLDVAAVDDDLARGVIRLVRDAYAAQYGGRQASVEAFYEAYDPDNPDKVAYRRQVLTERVQSEKTDYWVVRGEEPDRLDGLVRVLHDYGQTYLADIITAPPWRRGIGSRGLHASLTKSGLPPSNTLSLDGFQGSSVNKWYESLGLNPGSLTGYMNVGSTGYRMLHREYATPASVGVGGVVRALEAKRPSLARARVHHTRPVL